MDDYYIQWQYRKHHQRGLIMNEGPACRYNIMLANDIFIY